MQLQILDYLSWLLLAASVIGCGYLGAVHAASMAVLGFDVVGVDVDPELIEAARQAGRLDALDEQILTEAQKGG